MVTAVVEPERLIFVDECGTHTSLGPIYGYAPRGERLYLSVARNRGKNTTLLSSMSLEGMGSSLTVEGSTTARVFETYVEKVLAPSLKEGQVVVMDNLSAHKPKRIREFIEQQGCDLVYLPSYSPDYNPIEEAFEQVALEELLGSPALVPGAALQGAVGLLRRRRVAQPVSTSRASATGPPALSRRASRSSSPEEEPGRLR